MARARAAAQRGTDGLREATKNYDFRDFPPPGGDLSAVTQLGGLCVFDGERVLYAWRDAGVGDHAPMADVLGACCAAPRAR